MEAAVQAAEQQLGSRPQEEFASAEPAAQSVRASLRMELALLEIDWFVSVLSRLHINVFRVGCMIPPGSGSSDSGRRAPVPAMGAVTSGSAAFLVASLFNHSCEPNVEVVFRRNDSTATFVAARDIDQGEQLFVSYLDEGMGLKYRQNHLRFSYGFTCGCQRCIEEAEDERASQQ